jgi:hypothetical protein
MSLASKNSKSVLALSALAVVYFAVQWLGASTMGKCRIFSSSATADRANFATMVNQFSTAAGRDCASGSPRKILFEDEDVITPYLVGVDSALGRCEVVRLTPVTPLTEAEAEDCGNLLVTEIAPPGPRMFRYANPRNPNFARHQWAEMDRWASGDERYGFIIYRHPCPVPGDRKQ